MAIYFQCNSNVTKKGSSLTLNHNFYIFIQATAITDISIAYQKHISNDSNVSSDELNADFKSYLNKNNKYSIVNSHIYPPNI